MLLRGVVPVLMFFVVRFRLSDISLTQRRRGLAEVWFSVFSGLFVADAEEGEDAVGVAGGEETAGVGEGVGGAAYVGVGVFAVAGVAEDPFDGLFAVFGMEFDHGFGVGVPGIGCLLEAYGVAAGVGEDGVAFSGCGLGEVVEAAGLAHLVGGEGVGEEVGDVDGGDIVFCLGGCGEGDGEEQKEG